MQVRVEGEVFPERMDGHDDAGDTTGHLSEYTLQPYHLLAYHGNWYVFARNMAKDRVATFAISRFRRIEPTGCCSSRNSRSISRRFDVIIEKGKAQSDNSAAGSRIFPSGHRVIIPLIEADPYLAFIVGRRCQPPADGLDDADATTPEMGNRTYCRFYKSYAKMWAPDTGRLVTDRLFETANPRRMKKI